MTWFALYCEPQREQFAHDRLKDAGYTVFYPHIIDWFRSRLVRKPYYPRYLFVDCLDEHWIMELAGIKDVPGVIGSVKGTGRMPHRIARARLQPLFEITDYLGAVHVPESPKPLYGLHRGNRFKVAEGNPFWNMVATVEDIDDKHIITTIDGLIGRVMIAPDQVGEVLAGAKDGRAKANGHAARAAG